MARKQAVTIKFYYYFFPTTNCPVIFTTILLLFLCNDYCRSQYKVTTICITDKLSSSYIKQYRQDTLQWCLALRDSNLQLLQLQKKQT